FPEALVLGEEQSCNQKTTKNKEEVHPNPAAASPYLQERGKRTEFDLARHIGHVPAKHQEDRNCAKHIQLSETRSGLGGAALHRPVESQNDAATQRAGVQA